MVSIYFRKKLALLWLLSAIVATVGRSTSHGDKQSAVKFLFVPQDIIKDPVQSDPDRETVPTSQSTTPPFMPLHEGNGNLLKKFFAPADFFKNIFKKKFPVLNESIFEAPVIVTPAPIMETPTTSTSETVAPLIIYATEYDPEDEFDEETHYPEYDGHSSYEGNIEYPVKRCRKKNHHPTHMRPLYIMQVA